MNERMPSPGRQLSEVEKNLLDIRGKLAEVPELHPNDVTNYEDSTEGLVEQLVEEGKERATIENISAAIKQHAAENDGAKPLNANEFDNSIEVDTSELDSDYEEFRSPSDMDKAA